MKRNRLYEGHGKGRIWELDFLRGFCIILMIFDHALYDLAYVFPYQWFGDGREASGILYMLTRFSIDFYYPFPLRKIAWWIAVFCFIFICGISCSFSRSNFKRGLRLAAIALLLTVVTYGIDRYLGQGNTMIIRFGVLHMLSASILVYCFVKRLGTVAMIIISFLAIGCGVYFINSPLQTSLKYVGIAVKSTGGFYSSDYFPLLPWFGFFLFGAALGPIIYSNRRSVFSKKAISLWKKPILYIGRNSLIFYVLHQPVVYAILFLIGKLR